jgi:MFS family permease
MNVGLGNTARIVLSIYVPSVMMGFGLGLILPTMPDLATAFGVPGTLAAQVVTAQLVGRAGFLFPAGFIVDRLGRQHALVIGPLLAAGGALLTVLTPWFGALLVAQAVLGAGDSLWAFGREVAAVEQIRPDQRGRVMSSFFGISSAGIAFGPILGGVLTSQLGFRSVFLVYIALTLAVLALALAIPARVRREAAPRPSFSLRNLGDIEPAYRTTFVVLLFATFCAMLRSTAVQSMLPIYVVGHLGLTAADVGLAFGVVGLMSLLTLAPAGFVSDTLGRKAATVPAAALAGASFLAYYLAADLLGLMIASAILGITTGLATGSMTTFTYDIIPEESRGRFQALRRSVGELGSFTGPLVGGIVAAAYHPGIPFLVFAPLHLASALLLAFVARESLAGRRPSPGSA